MNYFPQELGVNQRLRVTPKLCQTPFSIICALFWSFCSFSPFVMLIDVKMLKRGFWLVLVCKPCNNTILNIYLYINLNAWLCNFTMYKVFWTPQYDIVCWYSLGLCQYSFLQFKFHTKLCNLVTHLYYVEKMASWI